MDLEITKMSGESFRLSDYDVTVRDFNVSSIPVVGNYATIEGRAGRVDMGADYGTRTIRVPFYIKAADMLDYPLLRDKLFELTTSREPFYIRELRRASTISPCGEADDDKYVGGKRYKVRLANEYELDQQWRYGFGELAFETTDLPFAESIGTTLSTERVNILPLNARLWEQGYINNSGSEVDRTTSVRTKNYIPVYAVDYEISLEQGNRLYIRQYDASKNYLDVPNISVGEGGKDVITLDERTSYIKAYINADEDITPIDIGGRLIAYVTALLKGINAVMGSWGYGMGLIYDEDAYRYSFLISSLNNAFKVYNAGNVPIHPFEQDLKIEIYNILGSADTLELVNKTNGTTFKVNEGSTSSATVITLDGPNVTRNGQAYLRSTNRQFIELEPGWNEFEIRGPRTVGIDFDFRFYYK